MRPSSSDATATVDGQTTPSESLSQGVGAEGSGGFVGNEGSARTEVRHDQPAIPSGPGPSTAARERPAIGGRRIVESQQGVEQMEEEGEEDAEARGVLGDVRSDSAVSVP